MCKQDPGSAWDRGTEWHLVRTSRRDILVLLSLVAERQNGDYLHVIGGKAGPMSNCIHHQVIEQQKEKETQLNTIQYNTTKRKA